MLILQAEIQSFGKDRTVVVSLTKSDGEVDASKRSWDSDARHIWEDICDNYQAEYLMKAREVNLTCFALTTVPLQILKTNLTHIS